MISFTVNTGLEKLSNVSFYLSPLFSDAFNFENKKCSRKQKKSSSNTENNAKKAIELRIF